MCFVDRLDGKQAIANLRPNACIAPSSLPTSLLGRNPPRKRKLARVDRDETSSTPPNTRRSATQHAADSLWPYFMEATRPIRKTFSLLLTRAMEFRSAPPEPEIPITWKPVNYRIELKPKAEKDGGFKLLSNIRRMGVACLS